MRLAQYMPRVDSRQASLNKPIWFTVQCYLSCSGEKVAYITPFQRICNARVGKQMCGYLAPSNLRFKLIFYEYYIYWFHFLKNFEIIP